MEAAHAPPDTTTSRSSTPALHDADVENELDAIIADSDLGIRAVNQDAFEREVAAQVRPFVVSRTSKLQSLHLQRQIGRFLKMRMRTTSVVLTKQKLS